MRSKDKLANALAQILQEPSDEELMGMTIADVDLDINDSSDSAAIYVYVDGTPIQVTIQEV